MTTTADERLVVMLEARIAEFEKRMRQAEGTGSRTYQKLRRDSQSATRQMEEDMNRASGRIGQAVTSITGKIGTFGKAFAGGLVAGVTVEAVRAIVTKVNELARSVAEVGDAARRAGMSAQAFQEWSYVAEQNRIGIDQMVDGLKELQLRGDEFAVTGKGSAAEAFQRLGYSAEDVARKLKDPSALMLEILGRLEQLDKAAQIRIADELFGGSAGERFVELLEQGADRIADTKKEAADLGIVMSDELIAKADQLNREFNTVAATVGVALKSAIISAAASLSDFIDGFREFENQRSTTLQTRQTEIMHDRAKLYQEMQGLNSGEGLTDNARNLGFGPDSAVTQSQIAELQGKIDALTVEEDKIISILSSRTPITWTPTKDEWVPPAVVPPGSGVGGGGGTSSTRGSNELEKERLRLLKEEQTAMDDLQRATERGAAAITDVLFAGIEHGADGAREAVLRLLMELARSQLTKALAASGGPTGGFLAGLGKMLSFEGGGSTGNGPRSGGLDGKGGFMAMVHPRETITDHARGDGAQVLTGNIGVTVDGEGNVKAYVQRMSVQAAQSAYVAALQDTRRNLGSWSQQLNTDGALV